MEKRYEDLLQSELDALAEKNILKGKEQSITGIKGPADGYGPRCFLEGQEEKPFLVMNSNSYLGLSTHPDVIRAEEEAARNFGSGPGAVRFISGTFQVHVELEKRLAAFHGKEAGMLFSSAYAAVMGVLPQLISPETAVLSDELNHNCIINAIRLARPTAKGIYTHLDLEDLEEKIRGCIGQVRRIVLVTDGVFSMRGDHAPLDQIAAICAQYSDNFAEGILTVADDSHGAGVFGSTGRGTEEYTGGKVDVLIATLGKAFGVNGGYAVTKGILIDYLRERAPFYVYSNPITPAEAAAGLKSLELIDSAAGINLLEKIRSLTTLLENGLQEAGFEVLTSEHPIVPVMIRDTAQTEKLVHHLFAGGVLATGLKFPVVPHGDEEVRLQVSANHTEKDIHFLLQVMKSFQA